MLSEALPYLIISIICITILILGSKWHNEFTEKSDKRKEEQNVFEEVGLIHVGGHPYLKANDLILFQIRKNNTICFYKNNIDTDKEIPMNQVVKYEFKTEDQIQKDATLGRFLMFGIASLALQKKTTSHNEYLYLTYIDNGITVECLFKNFGNKQVVGNIISAINRLKIESKECAI